MKGGNNNDDEMYGSSKKGNNREKEKQTLTPITAKIFNDATVNQSELIEYKSIPLYEVNLFLNIFFYHVGQTCGPFPIIQGGRCQGQNFIMGSNRFS